MPIEIRHARREELPLVNELRRQVNELHVKGRPGHFKPGFGPELQKRLYELFDSDRFGVIVAAQNTEILGFALVQYVHRPESLYTLPLDFYHVEEFGVDAVHRRRGVARAMVEFMKQDALERGFDRIDLDVWAFNGDALAFYETAGFTTYRSYMELNLD